jgi:L-threonylcarbamoyladenylate synthase
MHPALLLSTIFAASISLHRNRRGNLEWPVPQPSEAEIQHAARLLRAGRVVAFPTETVYGLGANALASEAVARIYEVKRRPPTSPLIVHVDSVAMAQSLVAEWSETADVLARKFWPGPLTLVLKVRSGRGQSGPDDLPSGEDASAEVSATIPLAVTAGLNTVGIRMPSHPVALSLIRAAGVPLAAPSANRFTELSPTTAEHVRQSLGRDVDYILDGGPCTVGIESTVLSLVAAEAVLLRPGGISRQELEAVIGHRIGVASDPSSGPHPAPGMRARHYSPRTSLLLVMDEELPKQGRGIYLQHMRTSSRADVETIRMPSSASDYAAALYRRLHEADEGKFDWIAVDLPPVGPEWEAVHDRLRRAATSA